MEELRCESCNKIHEGTYGSGRFCSQECARSFSTKDKRKEINEKVSKTLKSKYSREIIKDCLFCGKEISLPYYKRKQKTCSRKCGAAWVFSPNNPERDKITNQRRDAGLKSARAQSKKRRSKNEILFYSLCKNEYNNVLSNEAIFNGWDADVILPEYNVAVLWNGPWHYKKITKSHSVEQVQNRDKIKEDEIKKAGYTAYIIKDMGKYNPEFVRTQFELFKDWIAVI